jgi:hypothetical protein
METLGPGRFDAELDKDGKAFRPDGGQAGTLDGNTVRYRTDGSALPEASFFA